MRGRVYLVGAGPGDPELLTLKAVRCLREADVVVYDRLVDERTLEHTAARRIYVGKQPGAAGWRQEAIHALLIRLARRGQVVVRLKGGDPYLFGRGAEEWDALVNVGVPVEVVPGVSSALAGPAAANIPVTCRGAASMVTVVSGHADPSVDGPVDWPGLARLDGTLVILMGMGNLAAITEGLLRLGKAADTPAAVVENATLGGQRVATGTLSNIAARVERARLGSPAVVVIGRVAARARVVSSFVGEVIKQQRSIA